MTFLLIMVVNSHQNLNDKGKASYLKVTKPISLLNEQNATSESS